MPGKPKPIDKTKTLQYAREHGEMERFIAEHENDDAGDLDKLDEVIKRSGKENAQPKAMIVHASDCALHNGPALEPGECDCGATVR